MCKRLKAKEKRKGPTLLVRGLQTLAVATPRSSERDNCIMILVLFKTKIELNRGTHENESSDLQEQLHRKCECRG